MSLSAKASSQGSSPWNRTGALKGTESHGRPRAPGSPPLDTFRRLAGPFRPSGGHPRPRCGAQGPAVSMENLAGPSVPFCTRRFPLRSYVSHPYRELAWAKT
jgi:hypothetical protein